MYPDTSKTSRAIGFLYLFNVKRGYNKREILLSVLLDEQRDHLVSPPVVVFPYRIQAGLFDLRRHPNAHQPA